MLRRLIIPLVCGYAFLGRMSAQEVVIMREQKAKIPKAEAVAENRARLQRALEAKTEFHVEKAIRVQSVNAPEVQTQPGVARPVIVHAQRQQQIAAQPAKPEVQTARAIPAQSPNVKAGKPEVIPVTSAPQQIRKSVTQAQPNVARAAIVQVQTQRQAAPQPAKPAVQTARTVAVPPATMQTHKPEAIASSSPKKEIRQADTLAVQSVSLQGATAFTKLANGFDFPIGKPDAQGYYKARGFRSKGHLGEDWDGVRGGDTDLGDPIYCIGDGVVVFARDCHQGWGNVIIVRHAFREGGTVKNVDSLYGHLQKILVRRGQTIKRGQQIAAIGNAHGLYDAHLHLEVRKNIAIGMSRDKFAQDSSNYYDPSDFIAAHRHLQSTGASYRVAMNTFTYDSRIQWDKLRNYSHARSGGGSSESAYALKKALASQSSSAH